MRQRRSLHASEDTPPRCLPSQTGGPRGAREVATAPGRDTGRRTAPSGSPLPRRKTTTLPTPVPHPPSRHLRPPHTAVASGRDGEAVGTPLFSSWTGHTRTGLCSTQERHSPTKRDCDSPPNSAASSNTQSSNRFSLGEAGQRSCGRVCVRAIVWHGGTDEWTHPLALSRAHHFCVTYRQRCVLEYILLSSVCVAYRKVLVAHTTSSGL